MPRNARCVQPGQPITSLSVVQIAERDAPDQMRLLRRCTFAGRPFGEEEFLLSAEQQFQRKWRHWDYEAFSASGR